MHDEVTVALAAELEGLLGLPRPGPGRPVQAFRPKPGGPGPIGTKGGPSRAHGKPDSSLPQPARGMGLARGPLLTPQQAFAGKILFFPALVSCICPLAPQRGAAYIRAGGSGKTIRQAEHKPE